MYSFPRELADVFMDGKVVLISGLEPPWDVDRIGDEERTSIAEVYIRLQCRENIYVKVVVMGTVDGGVKKNNE